MTVFVDTSAFFALLDRDDDEHRTAVAELDRIVREGPALVTHEYAVVETVSLVQRRLGPQFVRTFVDDLLAPVEIEWVDRDVHLEAREAMLAAGDRSVSLVDWTSFLVMRRRGIATAFAFDDDFRAHGFELRPG